MEFGVKISDGCDHAMVAGHDSCSCPACGVVCHGQNAGCPLVWTAGPKAVSSPSRQRALPPATRAADAINNNHQPLASSSNGGGARLGVDPVPPASDGGLRKLYESLLSEIRLLNQKIDRVANEARPVDTKGILDQVDARFAWLTEELSDRLVILGNEIMAVKRHVTGEPGEKGS